MIPEITITCSTGKVFINNITVEWLAKVITFDMFSMMVDEAIEQMRTMLDSNEAVQKLIANEAGEGSE